jgi:two-component system sensor kinase FixL
LTKTTETRPVPVFDEAAQRALMDVFLEGIIVIDIDGNVEQFNEAAEKMFGFTRDEMIGENIARIMPSPDRNRHQDYIGRYLKTGVAKIIGVGREVHGQRKDGSYFPIHLAIGEVGWHGKISFVATLRDLTDNKLAEERTLRLHTDMLTASRLTTMGEMAAAMAHEINQPLAAIANYAAAGMRLLGNAESAPDDISKALKSIDEQAHRAGEIIKRLRNFVQPELATRETTNLRKIFHEIKPLAELDARANNIALKFDIPKDLPEIDADQLQIQQVILNLLRNSVDAMTDARPEDRLLMATVYPLSADHIRVDVIDRGHGIPEEIGRKLFNPFFTTKDAGMGMGLAICGSIINAHHGTLSFENNPDVGATFSITLPVKDI